MKNILVLFWEPEEIGIPKEEINEETIRNYCFRVRSYDNEGKALYAYANTRATYSTLLDEKEDYLGFIDMAIRQMQKHNWSWLEEHFV